jgi:hypothetical protein
VAVGTDRRAEWVDVADGADPVETCQRRHTKVRDAVPPRGQLFGGLYLNDKQAVGGGNDQQARQATWRRRPPCPKARQARKVQIPGGREFASSPVTSTEHPQLSDLRSEFSPTLVAPAR